VIGRPSPILGLWTGVDRLIDRSAGLDDLRAHRIHLLAARRWRALGLDVPAALQEEERRAAIFSLVVPRVLEDIRAVCDGTLLLLKGPEVGAYYPDPALRPATDIDLLAEDPEGTQARLLDAGFVTIGEDSAAYRTAHHLRPLVHSTLAVKVEIHRRPEWVKWGAAPSTAELFNAAVPSATGIAGISTVPPAHHALLVAAHSWSTLPMRRISDLVDLEALTLAVDRQEVAALAKRWDVAGVYRTLIGAADALLLGAPRTPALRTWARDMANAEEPTVFRTHLRRLAGPPWALPPHRAARATLSVIAREVLPAPDETWRSKLSRVKQGLRHPRRRRSEHERHIGR
jgi:hypothetical protein